MIFFDSFVLMEVLEMYKYFRMVILIGILSAVVSFSACSNSPKLFSIAVTPANPSIASAATQQFTATGTYTDNTTKDITSSVTWTSGTASVATINTSGLATGIGAGTSVITATSGSISGTTNLTVTSSATVDVYVVGCYRDAGPSHNSVATVWKNGDRTDLTDGALVRACANSVYVSGGDVYVAGYYDDGITQAAAVWKNGTKMTPDLPSDGNNARALSIYVADGHVYVAGYYTDTRDVPVYWVDGAKMDLSSSYSGYSEANSIYVSGADVYVAGAAVPSTKGGGGSIYVSTWTHGTQTNLIHSDDVSLGGIYVDGSNVYVACGYYDGSQYVAAVFKNEDKTILTDSVVALSSETMATSVYVDVH